VDLDRPTEEPQLDAMRGGWAVVEMGSWSSTPAIPVANDAQNGTLTAPVGTTYTYARISNSTPWIVTLLGQMGSVTLQPFTFDLLPTIPPNGVTYSMSLPPGGPTVAPVGQPVYLQVDWWIGPNLPPGSYPGALVSQAITAGIAGLIGITTQTFEAAEGVSVPFATPTEVLNLTTAAYPSGTVQANYNTAIVQVQGEVGEPLGVTLWAEDAAGSRFYVQLAVGPDSSSYTAAIPIAGMASVWAEQNIGTGAVTATVTLTQEVVPSPSVLAWSPSSAALVPLPVQQGGSPNLGNNLLVVGAQDTNGAVRSIPTIAGGAALIANPVSTASARSLQALSPGGNTTQFGPTGARTSQWFTLTVSINGVTCAAAGALEVQIADATTGQVLASLLMTLPVTANFPPGGVQASAAGPLSYPHAAMVGGDFNLITLVNGTVTGLSGRCVAVVGYQ
jgi:hypothetical protein